jgi:hypothetical protein
METLPLTEAETAPAPGRPRTCARCRHWGVIPHENADGRWRLCLQEPVAMAHADYWCPSYERRART